MKANNIHSITVPEPLRVNGSSSNTFQLDTGLVELHSKINKKKIYLGTRVSVIKVLVVRTVIYMFSLFLLPGWDFEVHVCMTSPNFVGPSWF